jgi:hypothetical protein
MTTTVIYSLKRYVFYNKFSRQFSTPSNIYYPYFSSLKVFSSSLPCTLRVQGGERERHINMEKGKKQTVQCLRLWKMLSDREHYRMEEREVDGMTLRGLIWSSTAAWTVGWRLKDDLNGNSVDNIVWQSLKVVLAISASSHFSTSIPSKTQFLRYFSINRFKPTRAQQSARGGCIIHLISWKIISFNASYFAIAILFSFNADLRGVESNYLLKHFLFFSLSPSAVNMIFAQEKDIYGYDFYCTTVPSIRMERSEEAERYHRKIALSDWALIQLWWIWKENFLCRFTTTQIHILLEGVILIFLLLLQSGSRFSFASYCAISFCLSLSLALTLVLSHWAKAKKLLQSFYDYGLKERICNNNVRLALAFISWTSS